MTPDPGYQKTSEDALDEARFDQPPLAPAAARRTYVICTTPRSGSWLLCRQLVNAGIGVPSEYFNAVHLAVLSGRWNVDPRDTRAFLDALRAHRTTPNGACGIKLLWYQYAERRAALRTRLLAGARLVHLYRDDVVAQAVSLHLSEITGVWDFTGDLATVPRTDIAWGDPSHLAECERVIRQQNRWWSELFGSLKHEPLTIRYEDFVADPPAGVRRLAEDLGIPPGAFRTPPPEPRELSFPPEVESRRRELVERWRSMRGAGERS